MNILQVVSMSLALYRRHMGWYVLAGLMLFVAAVISAGLFSAGFLLDCMIALALGQSQPWTNVPAAVLAIALASGVEALAGAYIAFSAWGAFVHLCAQIGASSRPPSLLDYFEHMHRNGAGYFFIGAVQQAAGLLPAGAILAGGILLSPYFAPLAAIGALAALAVWLTMQMPFWLAYPAQIIRRRGVAASIQNSMSISLSSPLASLLCIFMLAVLALAPAVLNVFYPFYLFFVFAPLYATIKLAYFEASSGMLK